MFDTPPLPAPTPSPPMPVPVVPPPPPPPAVVLEPPIAPDADVEIVALEADLLEAGSLQLIADQIGPAHREGTGAARRFVGGFFFFGDQRAHALLGNVEPRIVFALAPHDEREPAARFERALHVTQRRHRRSEELRAEARIGGVVRTAEVVGLHVGAKEVGAATARCLRVTRRGFDE